MKRIQKSKESPVILEGWKYPNDRKKIAEILSIEQQNFCAYTERRFSSDFKPDVEHFNPKRKNIPNDYFNWYAVGPTKNREKSDKWDNFQPILHPSDKDLEERVFYHEETGTYRTKPNDIEAKNLLKLLEINKYELSEERKKHINNLKKIKSSSENLFIYWIRDANEINFRRAIETVFNVKF